jgi:peptide/nickel transport system permease protein
MGDQTRSSGLMLARTAVVHRQGERKGVGASVWRRFARNRLAVAAFFILGALVLVALIGPLVIPESQVTAQVRSGTFAAPSAATPFGRDEFGRDAFVRAIYGGRTSLWVAFIATLINTILGVLLGMLGGYAGGWIDAVIDRFVELILTLPFLLLLILAAAVLQPSATSIVVILGLFGWPVLARIVRGEFVSLKGREFIEAARASGASAPRIVFRHMLPNAMAPIIVTATLTLATNLIAEATISYLGLGIKPPLPSWGNMLTEAQNYLIKAPYLAIFPGMLILITVLCVNLLGDGLRDALDPRLKR